MGSAVGYFVAKVLNDGLVVIQRDGDRAFWSRCKVRKPTRCVITQSPIEAGQEAFRPIGNQNYRFERIDATLIAGIIKKLRETGEEP